MTVLPIDKQRVGRVVLALLDGDGDKALAVINEAETDDRLIDYAEALLGAFLGMMRLNYGLDGTRQWANDWVLKAHIDNQASS